METAVGTDGEKEGREVVKEKVWRAEEENNGRDSQGRERQR